LLPIGTKQELLIADKHNDQWIESIKSYATAAKNAGDSVTVTMMHNAGHFDGLNPKSTAWETVLASIRSILGYEVDGVVNRSASAPCGAFATQSTTVPLSNR
jgi:hypothetical protein